VPSSAVERQDGVGSLGDVAGDFVEMELHRLDVGEGQRERRPDASDGTNGAEQIGALIALIGRLAGPRSSLGPLPHEAVLLSDTRFVLDVGYEDVIDRQEESVRKMLAFVGAPYDKRCLDFQANRRYARTASYAQVTERLYNRSRYRYRAYRDELQPVIPILEPVIRRLGYTID